MSYPLPSSAEDISTSAQTENAANAPEAPSAVPSPASGVDASAVIPDLVPSTQDAASTEATAAALPSEPAVKAEEPVKFESTDGELVIQLIEANARLAAAQDNADSIRMMLANRIDADRKDGDKGQKTFKVDVNGGVCSVTVKRGVNLSCNKSEQARMQQAFNEKGLSLSLMPLKSEPKLDEAALAMLEEGFPEAYNVAAKFVTAKPAKVAVELKF